MSKKQEPHEVYDEEFGQQTVIVEGDKADLPKLELPRGEGLYLNFDEVTEIHEKYYGLIGSHKEGAANASPELRSVMESVIFYTYCDEISKRRDKNKLDYVLEGERIESLNQILTPKRWRGWFFRKKRNQSQVLVDELVSRQAAAILQRKADELPSYPGEENGEELQPFEVVLAELRERLPHMRKKRSASIEKLIAQLANGYNSKMDELKQLAAELKEAKEVTAAMEERALHAEELLEEFLKESSPATEEEADPEEPEGSAPETEQDKEQAESETADGEEEESLSYDGLYEEDESD